MHNGLQSLQTRMAGGKQSVDEHGREIKMHFEHGTTTLGFMYQGGIILAVDSRATGGAYIGELFFKQFIPMWEITPKFQTCKDLDR